jgi:hypothetical protein
VARRTKPKSKVTFGEYFSDWIETYAGRTKRGFEEETRKEYRRSLEDDALSLWRDTPMVKINAAKVGFSLPGESYFVQILGRDLAATPDVRRIRDSAVISDEADQLEGSRQFG